MTKDIQVHGSIFFLLQKFVESNYGKDSWVKLNQTAQTGQQRYDMHENYSLSQMNSIISAAANLTGLSENNLKEKFGEHLVPDLLNIYKSYLNPAWKTFNLLENAEHVMHMAVRQQERKANPPVLNVTRVSDKLLIIDYYSKRKMANLAIGIIRGIAKYYNESDKINIIPVTNLNDERVQIKIEFK